MKGVKGSHDVPHGTNSRYQLGCRCVECREAHNAYAREYHRRVQAETRTLTIEVRDEEGRVIGRGKVRIRG